MILDYPDHTLLFPKKEETLTRCRFRPIPRQSFLLFLFQTLYNSALWLFFTGLRNRFSYFASRERISFKNS